MTGSAVLDQITSIDDLNRLSLSELELLADELRSEIVDAVAKTGGHLASSLGVIELTIALHRVFESPKDKIIWDVGHQAYAHKMLTGRRERFGTLRQKDGVSGFPKRDESEHDQFDVGHSSTSISAALGMAAARDLNGTDEKIVAVIGDGSLTAGMAFEGLNHAGHINKNLTVILNDNDMSISPNVGAFASFLGRKTSSDVYIRLKKEVESFLGQFPHFGKDIVNALRRTKNVVKGLLTPGMLFEAFGFHYYGPLDGHNMEELLETLKNVSQIDGPVLVHVITQKGKGYKPAEDHPRCFHGVGTFDPETGDRLSSGAVASYTDIFGQTLIEMAKEDNRLVAITAAMAAGTGLVDFAETYPDRFFDVGIAEQHAVTFAAGLATQGLKPFVTIYSTFLQRAYDQVLHDVCLQNLPVVFAMDRGGFVGADGPTHHGVFDLSYLRHMPNMTIMVPRNEHEMKRAMQTAMVHDGPFAFRYPRGTGIGVDADVAPTSVPVSCADKLRDGVDATILAVGPIIYDLLWVADELAKDGKELSVVDARFVKPLDEALILKEVARTGVIITAEENSLDGGFGSAVLELLSDSRANVDTLTLGIPDQFIEQGTQDELRKLCGLDKQSLLENIKTFLAS